MHEKILTETLKSIEDFKYEFFKKQQGRCLNGGAAEVAVIEYNGRYAFGFKLKVQVHSENYEIWSFADYKKNKYYLNGDVDKPFDNVDEFFELVNKEYKKEKE
jgi:hypothetical protein